MSLFRLDRCPLTTVSPAQRHVRSGRNGSLRKSSPATPVRMTHSSPLDRFQSTFEMVPSPWLWTDLRPSLAADLPGHHECLRSKSRSFTGFPDASLEWILVAMDRPQSDGYQPAVANTFDRQRPYPASLEIENLDRRSAVCLESSGPACGTRWTASRVSGDG